MIFNTRLKIFTGFLVILILLVIVSFYTLSINQKALEEAVGQGSVFLVEDTIQRIDKSMFLKIEELEKFSSDPLLQSALTESNEEFEEFEDIDTYIAEQDGAWTSTSEDEITPFIEEKLTNPLANRLQKVFVEFGATKYGYQIFGEVFVTNEYGALVSATGKVSDYLQSDEAWWKNAKAEKFSISEFEYDTSSAVWGIPISLRISNDEGKFLGVVKAIVPASIIAREAELTNKKYETSEITLLTDSHQVVYKTGVFSFLEDMSNENISDSISKGSGFFVATEEGHEKLFSYTNSKGFRNYEGLRWVLLLSHDTSEVFAPLRQLSNLLLGVIGVSFVAITCLSFVLSRSISVPIKRLTESAQIIASGDLNQQVEVKSKDEVGQLGIAFNVMTQKLKKSYEGLEEKITERTEELSESNHLKDLFIDIMRHDLLNPAGVVRMGVEIALDEKNPKRKEALELIEKSSDRLIEMIEDASIFSRLESGEKMELKKMDLAIVLKCAVEGMIYIASKSGIKINLDINGKFSVMANPLIEDVISNFISNAIKYGPQDSEIVVGIKESGPNWRMFVADKGEGIPDKHKKAIFDRFTRLEQGAVKGSGLGLGIVKKIIEFHNWKVWVEDNSPKGSIFIVELPRNTKNLK